MSAPAAPVRYTRNAATWYGFFLIATQIFMFVLQGNAMPFLQTEFGLTYRDVALHSAATALGVVIGGLFGRRVARPLGRPWSLRISALGMALAALILCVAPGPWVSIPDCLFLGLAGSLVISGVPAMMADLHGANRASALAEQAIMAYVVAILAPLLVGFYLGIGWSWRAAAVTGALAAALLVALNWRTLIPPSSDRRTTAPKALPPPFWGYWALLGLGCATEYSVLLWAPTFLERVVGFAPAAAATATSAFFIGMIVGRVILRVMLSVMRPRAILAIAYLTGIVGFALYWTTGAPLAAVAGLFLIGLGVAPQYPMSMSLGIGVAGGANDHASARMVMAFGLALLIAPASLGALADKVGLRDAHLIILALFVAAVVVFATAGVLERRSAAATAT